MGVRIGMRKAVCALLAVVSVAVGALGTGSAIVASPAGAAEPIQGIDVSNWQGTVDWAALRDAGYLFGFAKATEGVTFVDRTLKANRIGMTASGMVLRGLYHFARPGRNSAADEAVHFLETVGPLNQGEVPVLDLDVEGGPDAGAWAAEWMAIVEQATGHTPILYSGAYYLRQTPTAALTKYPLWVAYWGRNNGSIPTSAPNTDRWEAWTFWQFTSKGSVPGVSGYCDVSLFAGSVDDLAALGRVRSAGPPADPLGDAIRKALNDLAESIRAAGK
ncbi:MAG: glycoside hydrolase family 25 protein [Acidimicrobiales bacterium]